MNAITQIKLIGALLGIVFVLGVYVVAIFGATVVVVWALRWMGVHV